MMRYPLFVLTLSFVLFTRCAPLPGSAPPGTAAEQAEVIAAAEALFATMLSRDTTALRSMLHPQLRITSVRTGAGDRQVRVSTVDEFVASIGRGGEPLHERMWDPKVEIGNGFASLWAPYDFYIGDRFSHCGHDSFHFVRIERRWVIVGLSYTVQPNDCPPAPPR